MNIPSYEEHAFWRFKKILEITLYKIEKIKKAAECLNALEGNNKSLDLSEDRLKLKEELKQLLREDDLAFMRDKKEYEE